jgi:aminopeptidase C
MHERVSRLPHPVEPRKAAVLFGEQITKLFERPPQILRSIWSFHAVMQMNLHLAEAVRFQFGQSLEERAVILLAGIKVCVAERRAVTV